jgi:fumagillin biosynthesis cytochrome P450 monooxygenase
MLPVIAAVLVGALLSYHLIFRKNSGPPLPPGPKPLPIIGNVLDLPPKGVPEYQHWLTFKDKYGPLSSITILGQTLIIIQDSKIAHDLLEKNSQKASGRPYCCLRVNCAGLRCFCRENSTILYLGCIGS